MTRPVDREAALKAACDRRKQQEEQREAEEQRRLQERRSQAMATAVKSAEEKVIPPRLLHIVLAPTLFDTPALEAATRIRKRLIVLSGLVGTGKTVAACAWLHAWFRQKEHWRYSTKDDVATMVGRPPVFITAGALSRFEKYNGRLVEGLFEASRLVIDDLGVEFLDERGALKSFLEELINARYDYELETIITTNLSDQRFRERYEERFADRIREVGEFMSVGDTSLRKPMEDR